MAPTILVEDRRPVLVAGTVGGASIPLAVVQAIINMVDFAAPLAVAMDAARADTQLCPQPRVLCLEFARVAAEVQQELTERGHILGYAFCPLQADGIPRCSPEYHVYPEVQAVGTVLTSTGKEERNAVSDPRGRVGRGGPRTAPSFEGALLALSRGFWPGPLK